jgi:uncharacterized protein YgiM (DUF1202 family)
MVIIGAIVLALILVVLFYAFYQLVLKEDTATSTPSLEATATEQIVINPTDKPDSMATSTATSKPQTPTAIPTIPPTFTPEPTPTLRPPPEVITVGVRARVNISDGLAINLRDQPTLSASTVITQLVGGSEVDVIDGPEDADDLTWWNVDGGTTRVGWVVEGFGGETWLVPIGWTDQLPPLPGPAPEATPTAPAPEATSVVTPTATPTLVLTATPEVTPTVTPVLTPTATPVLTPTTTPEGGIPSPTVGGQARVTTKFEYVNLRAGPGLDAETVGELTDGTIVTILEGPEAADNFSWWKVDDGQGNTGWVAERVGQEVLLVPIP